MTDEAQQAQQAFSNYFQEAVRAFLIEGLQSRMGSSGSETTDSALKEELKQTLKKVQDEINIKSRGNAFADILSKLGPLGKALEKPARRAANFEDAGDRASTGKKAIHLALRSGFEKWGDKNFLNAAFKNAMFNNFMGGAGGGIAGGGILLAIYGALKGLSFTAQQIWSSVKENLSYSVLASNSIAARNAEARLGNFGFTNERGTNAWTYARFRNIVRRMGLRDDKVLADIVGNLAGAGIGGRTSALEDLYQGTLSKIAAEKVLGFQISDNLMQSLYRGSQGSLGREYAGAFDVQTLMQRFAYAATASRNQFGVQVSANEWFKVFDEQVKTLRGVNQDYTVLQRNMVGFSDMLTKNEATVSEINELYSASTRMSSSQIFKTLAFAGVGGGDLLRQKEMFLQRGFTAQGRIENAQLILQSMQGYSRLVGQDRWTQIHLLREELGKIGLGGIAKLPDPMKFLEKVKAGDKDALAKYEELSKDEAELLQETAKKLDTIANPLEQIRDVIFGWFAHMKWFGKTAETILGLGQTAANAVGGSSNHYLDIVKERDAQKHNELISKLSEIADNTKPIPEQHSMTARTANTEIVGKID